MRLQDVFNESEFKSEPEYRVSSFSYQDNDDTDKSNLSKVYLPAHVKVDASTTLKLTKDGETVLEDSWKNIKKYLKKNLNTLTGNFKIIDLDGKELHRFDVSSSQSN